MVKTKELTAMIFQAKNNLHTLSWPAQSPDLNPIENLWAEVKKSIRAYKKPLSNLTDMLKRLGKKFRSILSKPSR